MTRTIVAAFALASCAALGSASQYQASLSVAAKMSSRTLVVDNSFQTAMTDGANLATVNKAVLKAAEAAYRARPEFQYVTVPFAYASNIASVIYRYTLINYPDSGIELSIDDDEYYQMKAAIETPSIAAVFKASLVKACEATPGVTNCVAIGEPSGNVTKAAMDNRGGVTVTTWLQSRSYVADARLAAAWRAGSRRAAIITRIRENIIAALGGDFQDATANVTHTPSDVIGDFVTIHTNILSAPRPTDAEATAAAVRIRAKLEAPLAKTALALACDSYPGISNAAVSTGLGAYMVRKNPNVVDGGAPLS